MVGFLARLTHYGRPEPTQTVKVRINYFLGTSLEKGEKSDEENNLGGHTIRPIRPKPLKEGNKVSKCQCCSVLMMGNLLDPNLDNHFEYYWRILLGMLGWNGIDRTEI